MAKLTLILVIQQRIFRIAHASFGSTMTMITCVITVIVHTITGWVSNCLSKISCSTGIYTHSSRLCKYCATQSILTSVLTTEITQNRALSVAVGMSDREAYVYVAVVWMINNKGREMVAVSLWESKNVKLFQLIFQRDRDWFLPAPFLWAFLSAGFSRHQQVSVL